MGVIPIVATEYVHWLPYFPALNWSKFAVLTNSEEFPRTAAKLRGMGDEEFREMQKELLAVNGEFFQWDGFFRHFELFLEGGKSYFTCSKQSLTLFK
jgi:hypothetical protein